MSTYWASALLQTAVFTTVLAVLALTVRPRPRIGWLAAAVGVVLLRRILTRLGHQVLDLGDLIPALSWDWSARLLALAGTVAVLLLLRDTRLRDAGLTLRQAPGSWRSALPVALGLVAAQVAITAIVWPGNSWSPEELAYQATMPGIEEDPFYWGLLLLLLERGVGLRWGAAMAALLFGLVHGLGWNSNGLRFDPWNILRTAAFGAGYCWLRVRTGSLGLSIAAHNLGNTLRLFV